MRYWPFTVLFLASCVAPTPLTPSIVRLEKKPGESFASVVRSVDARQYQGRSVVVSARVKSIGIPEGPNGVWLRVDGPDQKPLSFASSYQRPLIGDSEWAERRAVLDIDSTAERIVFGAINSSSGTLLVADLEVQPVANSPADALSTRASEYLEDALDKIRRLAYYSDHVDWRRARSTALVLASGAQTTDDTYDAVRYVLALLGDHHSHLLVPAYVRGGADQHRT
jgi:hypothetical protein